MEDPTHTTPEYVVPGSKPKEHSSWKKPILIGLAAIILVAAAAYYVMQREPSDTQAFTYIETSPIGEVAKVLEGGALVAPVFAGEGIVSEYVKQGEREVAIVRTLAATSTEADIYRAFDTDVYLLGEEARRLTTNGVRKGWLDVSSDGTQIAYAFVDSENPLANENPQPSDWSVAVLTIATGDIMTLGRGVAPQFIETDAARVVVVATTGGLAVYDLSTGAASSYDAPEFKAAFSAFDVSPDGRHLIVRDRGTEQHAVYAIDGTVPDLSVSLVGYVPGLITAALSNARVYGLAVTDAGSSEVRSYSLNALTAESSIVRTLPEGSAVIRLIPHY